MASFFNSIGSGIKSSISWFDNTGVGGFFTNTLHSTSYLISGIANIPSELGGLVNSIAGNSTLFFWSIIIIGAAVVINDFKGSSSTSYYSSGRYW